MKRFYAHISSRNTALQQRPEVLKGISVYAAIHILHGMVNDLMLIFSLQPFVASHLITVKGRSSLHVFSDHRLHAAFLTIPHDFGANLPATLNESHDGSFIVLHASGNAALLYAQVHVASFPSDVGFVYFDFAAIATKFRAEEIILHCEPDAMQHKPCRLLGNPQITRNFVAADSVLAVGD